METIRVLIIDDSPLMRNYLTDRIGSTPGFEVVATAHNGADAQEKILAESPDVITLDVELPDTNGIELLEQIMKTKPTPVVMVSGLTQSGSQTTLRALQVGATDFMGKPSGNVPCDSDTWITELMSKLRRAAGIQLARSVPLTGDDRTRAVVAERKGVRSARKCQEKLILVGGGSRATDAARQLVLSLPRDCPPVLIALQCSPGVSKALLLRLSRECSLHVKFATDGETMVRGHVYLGTGDEHVSVARMGAQWRIKLNSGEPVRGYRPSLDLMFESASKHLGQEITGVLLDSTGDDGLVGLRFLSTNHSRTFQQSSDDSGGLEVKQERFPSATRSYALEPVVLPLERIVDALFGT